VFQLNTSDLDGSIEPTKSWLHSITQSRHTINGKRLLNTVYDNSDFIYNFSLERSQGGNVFDGFSTYAPVNTKLRFTPLFAGANDVYNIPDPANPSAYPPAPQLWLCRDTSGYSGMAQSSPKIKHNLAKFFFHSQNDHTE